MARTRPRATMSPKGRSLLNEEEEPLEACDCVYLCLFRVRGASLRHGSRVKQIL